MIAIPCPTCGTSIPVLPPERVVAYLEGKGWTLDGGDGEFAVYRLGDSLMQVALHDRWRDYPRRFIELLHELARIEGRAAVEIAGEMGR